MASADARAALAGNPSDGYGGAVLAVTLEGLRAEAEVADSTAPPSELVEAAVKRLRPGTGGVRWSTSIPRGVGLGGSSALVIATLRALAEWDGNEVELAELALAVETEDLGIVAGLQDRIAQAFGGLIYMDFAAGRYERLSPALLPPLVVAWRTDAGGSSGEVHRDLRRRYERGEAGVRRGMTELAQLARSARAALLEGDRERFGRCVDGSFDARAQMLALERRHVEMIEVARGAGASANYTGSGGAIACVCHDQAHRTGVAEALEAVGCVTVER